MTRYDILLKKRPPRQKKPRPIKDDPTKDWDEAQDIVSHGLQMVLASARRIQRLRPQIAPYYENVGLQYKKEHATIQLLLPRRSGSTSLAVQLVMALPQAPYVVFKNNNMLKEFQRLLRDHCVYPSENEVGKEIDLSFDPPEHRCATIDSRDFLHRGDDRRRRCVIADGASQFTREEMDRFYQLSAEAYILLG